MSNLAEVQSSIVKVQQETLIALKKFHNSITELEIKSRHTAKQLKELGERLDKLEKDYTEKIE